MKLAPVITWPLLVSPKKQKNSLATKIPGLKNILMAKVCSELAREQCQSSLGACSLVRSLFRVRPEFVRSLFGVRPEFVRSSFGVCSEFVRSSFGVRSELVRSSFGVCSFGACSELVHGEPGASEKRLPRKTRSAPYYVACGQNPKKCAHAGFVADHCFLCENSQLPQTQAQSAKIRAEFGLQHNAFCSYRRGGVIVKRKAVQALSSWRPRLISA